MLCSLEIFPKLSDEQAKRCLSTLKSVIDRSVTKIVSEQQRGLYAGAVVFPAALGEVRESRGEAGEKQRVMQKYREQFPYHSSFHAELRNHGMQDTRKGKTR